MKTPGKMLQAKAWKILEPGVLKKRLGKKLGGRGLWGYDFLIFDFSGPRVNYAFEHFSTNW